MHSKIKIDCESTHLTTNYLTVSRVDLFYMNGTVKILQPLHNIKGMTTGGSTKGRNALKIFLKL